MKLRVRISHNYPYLKQGAIKLLGQFKPYPMASLNWNICTCNPQLCMYCESQCSNFSDNYPHVLHYVTFAQYTNIVTRSTY